MRYAEVNLFGVLVSPISVMMLAAWLVFAALHRIATRAGLFGTVWHPALFSLSLYAVVLSVIVLLARG